MKTMTCRQLGGPDTCNQKFHADTWEDIKKQSMNHGHEMFQKGDTSHLKAMQDMKEKMKNPESMKEWMDKKKEEFDALPEDE